MAMLEVALPLALAPAPPAKLLLPPPLAFAWFPVALLELGALVPLSLALAPLPAAKLLLPLPLAFV
jgi:hypothetical protein